MEVAQGLWHSAFTFRYQHFVFQVIGNSISENRLKYFYQQLQLALPRAKHSIREGKKVDLSYIIDDLCSIFVASVASGLFSEKL